jgi:hypothetical protein
MPNASLKGLRVYLAQGEGPAEEVQRTYWTRHGPRR